ncbi:bile acid:sodium symporter family protein [Succinivibrio dextrinosolvens]|uniref:Bile acid:Na+ symporter, BASS family n=1 Tax=Succinivibrio dextrinosolvens DSM 3072 TaxID=1123324 RepID=A0A1T4VY85_9GAMM|nr:bile acid:sodium symporter family protein [Succinivibrio dextrinosolvens]SKA69956.1 bile acid:Na+ symporter, BASS family [Succinivibrio dextrinosolvens DSM 3072]
MSKIILFLERLSSFFSKTFAFWVIFFAVIAYLFPDFFKPIAAFISILLGIVMFGMGLTLSPHDFSEVFKRPIQVVIGMVGQFVIMPTLAFVLVMFLNLPPEIASGVMLVGCCPGGTASNVMSFIGKGDVPLSVTITACTTLLAPVVTPALFYFFASQWINIDPYSMFISIIQIVILPIIAGVFLNFLFRDTVSKVVVCLPMVSVFAIISIVAAVVAASAERLASTGLLIFAVVVLHNCLGYVFGYSLAKLFRMKLAQKKTLAIEIGMQNSGLSVALANKLAMTGAVDPIAAVPGAIFSVWHNISGTIIATLFANMSDKEEISEETEQVSSHDELKESIS